MHTAMVISPHADDAAAFCGGTLAKFAAQGWRVVLVRVTDDAKDSVGLTEEETISRNTEELAAAAKILGVAEIVELGFPTDRLADEPLTTLRERFVYLLRKHRPYAVFSFDPFGMYEGNMDHIRVAQAVEEAFWVSCFDLHHPGHFKEGLEPFAPCERWYFGRSLPDPNHAEDITGFLETKVAALCAHKTMLKNILQQLRLQLRTWGRQAPALEAAFHGDPAELAAFMLHGQAQAAAHAHGLEEGQLAECFRLDRFGDLEEFLQQASEPIPGAPEPPHRPGLDADEA